MYLINHFTLGFSKFQLQIKKKHNFTDYFINKKTHTDMSCLATFYLYKMCLPKRSLPILIRQKRQNVYTSINVTIFAAPDAHYDNQCHFSYTRVQIFENPQLIKKMKCYKPKRSHKYS